MMVRRFVRGERGLTMVLVLALMALAIPLVTAALGMASTVSLDSRVKAGLTKSQYSALGGAEYSLYRLVYESGYADGLTAGTEDSFTITLNGQEVTVTALKLLDPGPEPPPPSIGGGRRLQTTKEVAPTVAVPDTLTTFTYTITVENRDDESENVSKIRDGLPPGFTYVVGSTNGVTTADPDITLREGEEGGADYYELKWNLGSLNIVLQPGESVTLSFDAEASVATGNYCNEAWADPGGRKTSSGKTAKVVVGTPLNGLCGGQALTVTKTVTPDVVPGGAATTFTYTIVLENIGTATLEIKKVRDLLPPDFIYVNGSTQGDVTAQDPAITMFQGRQRLDWTFNPEVGIAPGETKTISFDAQATPAPGNYWNEVWVTLEDFNPSVYTWPTALVRAMGVFESSSTSGDTTAFMELWLGSDSYLISQLVIS